MVSDHSFVNQLTVGRVHARRAIEVENTDRTVAGVYTKQKYQKKPCCFATKKRKKDVGTQLTHIRQPRTAQAAVACDGLIYLLSLTTSEVSA